MSDTPAPIARPGLTVLDLGFPAILLTLLVVAGRVMPFFAQAAIPGTAAKSDPWAQRLGFGLAALWVAADASTQAAAVTAAVLDLALVQGLRLAGWHDRRVWGIPILAGSTAGP